MTLMDLAHPNLEDKALIRARKKVLHNKVGRRTRQGLLDNSYIPRQELKAKTDRCEKLVRKRGKYMALGAEAKRMFAESRAFSFSRRLQSLRQLMLRVLGSRSQE